MWCAIDAGEKVIKPLRVVSRCQVSTLQKGLSLKESLPEQREASTRKETSSTLLEEEESDEGKEYLILHLGSGTSSPPVEINLVINEQPLYMELDTGVAPSIVSETTFHQLWPTAKLSPSDVRLRTYSGEALSALGKVNVCVKHKEQKCSVTTVGCTGQGP